MYPRHHIEDPTPPDITHIPSISRSHYCLLVPLFPPLSNRHFCHNLKFQFTTRNKEKLSLTTKENFEILRSDRKVEDESMSSKRKVLQGNTTRTRVGKYELGKTLGEGSFAKVKFAKNVETGECVAIKILDRDQVLRHRMVEQVKTKNSPPFPLLSSISSMVRAQTRPKRFEIDLGRQ